MTSTVRSAIASVQVKAWMLAKITRSSSALVSSRQLFKLKRTVSLENFLQQEPPAPPKVHPQPSYINFTTFSTSSSLFSVSLSSAICVVMILIEYC